MPIPIVVGTTGFSEKEMLKLYEEGKHRPIMIGANFTLGFENFLKAAHMFVNDLPIKSAVVGEVYNAKKKPDASGTTQRICKELGEKLDDKVNTDIQRIGDTPGVNTITLNYGAATISLQLSVKSRDAYANGAIAAAKWLYEKPNGVYQPLDMIK